MPDQADGIRQFQPEDADACYRIVCDCLRKDTSLPSAARDSLLGTQSQASMLDQARLFYLAVYQVTGLVVGVGGVDLNEIRLLFVSPVYQHQGIGHSLLEHLETLVPAALFGDIFVYAAQGAEDFYRAHGYRAQGDHRFIVGDAVVPTIFMTKTLAP
jgi:N-acetylglutamate synthase-like GNAT family acetyltransferase